MSSASYEKWRSVIAHLLENCHTNQLWLEFPYNSWWWNQEFRFNQCKILWTAMRGIVARKYYRIFSWTRSNDRTLSAVAICEKTTPLVPSRLGIQTDLGKGVSAIPQSSHRGWWGSTDSSSHRWQLWCRERKGRERVCLGSKDWFEHHRAWYCYCSPPRSW